MLPRLERVTRALESASRRQTTPERVTIFTDAQAAIRRMASEEPAPASSTRSRQGSTSPRCGGPGGASSSRFGGAQHTRESPTMRKPTSGQRLRRKSQTPAGWNGCATLTGRRHVRCRSRAVFYIDQSGIILGKVGTGRDISRPINYTSELVWIYPDRPTLSLNRLNLYRPTNPWSESA